MGRRWCSNTASTANDLCAGNKGMPDLGQPKDWSLASAVGVKILPPAHNHGIKENDRSFKKIILRDAHVLCHLVYTKI
jgi:hypothetical protein